LAPRRFVAREHQTIMLPDISCYSVDYVGQLGYEEILPWKTVRRAYKSRSADQ